MISGIVTNYFETVSVIVFGIGFMMLLLDRNMIKKIIGFNFMDTAIYLFLAAKGYVNGRVAPILTGGEEAVFEEYINPVPSGLVLTGIVVSVSVSAFFLALAVRLYEEYHTLDLFEIVFRMQSEEEIV